MRVIITCGGYGHKTASGRFELVLRGERVDLPEEEAMRLVVGGNATIDTENAPVGVATPIGAQEDAKTGANTSNDSSDASRQETPVLDEAYLLSKTNAELKTIGESMGLDMTKCKKKADYVAVILAAEDVNDGEDLPNLGAGDLV